MIALYSIYSKHSLSLGVANSALLSGDQICFNNSHEWLCQCLVSCSIVRTGKHWKNRKDGQVSQNALAAQTRFDCNLVPKECCSISTGNCLQSKINRDRVCCLTEKL